MRSVAVGDIHGSANQLARLLDVPDLFAGRLPVFLGDYVDVGDDSRQVVDSLLAFRAQHPDVVFLKGNHDIGLMDYLSGGSFADYASAGGINTIRSYCGRVYGDVRLALRQAVPPEHLEFFSGLRDFFETSDYLFSHAGYASGAPLDRSVTNMVRAAHLELFSEAPTLSKVAVCGHYFQRSFKPFLGDRVICLDTGCGLLDGPLTAMTLPERVSVQVWPDGTISQQTGTSLKEDAI